MSILNILKKGHKIMVFLPRRGGRKLLFSLNVKNVEEIEERVRSKLEEYAEDIEIKQYKYVIAVDTKDNTEIKIENPYFDEESLKELAPKRYTREDVKGYIELELAQTTLESIKSFIPQLFSIALTSTTDVLKETFKKLVQTEEKTTLKDISSFIQSLVLLAQHKDQVKGLVQDVFKELKQAQQPQTPKEGEKQ